MSNLQTAVRFYEEIAERPGLEVCYGRHNGAKYSGLAVPDRMALMTQAIRVAGPSKP